MKYALLVVFTMTLVSCTTGASDSGGFDSDGTTAGGGGVSARNNNRSPGPAAAAGAGGTSASTGGTNSTGGTKAADAGTSGTSVSVDGRPGAVVLVTGDGSVADRPRETGGTNIDSSTVTVSIQPPGAASSNDELFDPERMPRFDLIIPPEGMSALMKEPRKYTKAEFRYGDDVVKDVGVRLKGSFSFRSIDKKAAFKIKFDEFVVDRSYRGLKRLTLNNNIEDPAQMSQRLAYLIYRATKVPAPRANSALVTVNGKSYGLYTNVESVDKPFLRRWFGSNDGNLYEQPSGADLVPGKETRWSLETNEVQNDRSDLTNLIKVVSMAKDATYVEDLGVALEMQRFLLFAAVEAFTADEDKYAYAGFTPRNFFIYSDPTTKKFTFIPWGADTTMRNDHTPLWRARAGSGVVFRRCLMLPGCKESYRTAVREVLAAFEALGIEAAAERIYRQVKDPTYADTMKETKNTDFESAYMGIRKKLSEKVAFYRAQLLL